MVKQTAMQLSQKAYVLADHSKLNESAFAKIAELHEAVLITDELAEEWLEPYKAKQQ